MLRPTVNIAVTILVSSLLLATSITITSTNATATDSIDNCDDKVRDSINSQVANIDKDKVRSVAENNDKFKAIKYVKEFKLISYTYSIDTSSCTGSLKNINAHYIAKEIDSGNPVKTITVIIDDKISKVEDVREGDIIYAYDYRDSPYWAGYSFYGNSYATNPVYESRARFYVPSVSKPTYPNYYQNNNACRTDLGYNPCILAVWTGLTNKGDPFGNAIAQGGSVGDVRCNANGCTIEYYLFFEFYPQPAYECRSNPPYNAGDDIVATVTSNGKNGGSSTVYTITVNDYTNGLGCGIFNYNFDKIPNPAYAAFIYERAAYQTSSNHTTLPSFTDNTMQGWLYYSGSTKSISVPYSNGWYWKFHMVNSSTTNVAVTSVSNGQFTAKYKTSYYT
jgi:hypothetical protein